MKLLFPFMLFLTVEATALCERTAIKAGNINFQIAPSSENSHCFFMISPDVVNNLVYRGYTFVTDGNLYLFSSYGQGPNSSTTGAREFYFFPRQHPLRYHFNESLQRLEIQHVNGDSFYFDYASAELVGSERGRFKVQPKVKKGDRGGVEILSYQGLRMDSGFSMGSAPTTIHNADSTFTDAKGTHCKVINKQLFNYPEEDAMSFRFDDQQLKDFLAEKCPTLQW